MLDKRTDAWREKQTVKRWSSDESPMSTAPKSVFLIPMLSDFKTNGDSGMSLKINV